MICTYQFEDIRDDDDDDDKKELAKKKKKRHDMENVVSFLRRKHGSELKVKRRRHKKMRPSNTNIICYCCG